MGEIYLGFEKAVIAASKTSISYADVKDLAVGGAVTLYPVFAAEEPQGPTQPAATTLKVSLWTKNGDWLTATEIDTLKSGYLQYLTAQGYDVSTLTITYVEAVNTKVDNLVAEIDGQGFDIVVGCGKDTKSLVYITGKKATMNFGTRYAAQLTENELAAHMYTFLTATAS